MDVCVCVRDLVVNNYQKGLFQLIPNGYGFWIQSYTNLTEPHQISKFHNDLSSLLIIMTPGAEAPRV